jgi:hypothetical protein
MRHPAAPTIIAVLLGFLVFMVLWSRVRSDDHHEGNPHPDDVPQKKENGPRVTDDGVVGDEEE